MQNSAASEYQAIPKCYDNHIAVKSNIFRSVEDLSIL
jgi:hypothetical protein